MKIILITIAVLSIFIAILLYLWKYKLKPILKRIVYMEKTEDTIYLLDYKGNEIGKKIKTNLK